MDKQIRLQNYQKLIIKFNIIISFFFGFGVFTLSTIQKLTSTIYSHPLMVSNASLHLNVLTKMYGTMKDIVLLENSALLKIIFPLSAG